MNRYQYAFVPIAQISSIYLNCHLKEEATKTTLGDFIPALVPKTKKPEQLTPEEESPPLSAEDVLLIQFDSYNQRVGGKRLV